MSSCPPCGLGSLRNLCKDGLLHEALQIVGLMHTRGFYIPPRAFYILLQACISKAHLGYGRSLLHLIVKRGLGSDAFLGSHSIRMFAVCGSLPEANQVFEALPKPNEFSWSAIILANASLGQGKQALKLYHRMQQSGLKPDGHIFVAALKACAITTDLTEGKHIENHIKQSDHKSDTFVGNALIDMYVKCGSFEDACRVFGGLRKQDVITWNTLMAGYAHHGHNEEAFSLFEKMQKKGIKPDPATFVSILKACIKPKFLTEGKIIHTCIVESGFELDVCVGNTLIHMYAMCGNLKHACRVFDNLPKSGVVTWNAMMTGYIQQGNNMEAFLLFQLMQHKGMQPNRVTFLCILKACSDIASIDLAKQIHAHIIETSMETDTTLGNSLIDIYTKCGGLGEASWVFGKLPKRVIVTWNTIISGYVQHGQAHKALELFYQMQKKGMQPDQATFVSILKACSTSTAAPHQGLEIHALIIMAGFEGEIMVGNSVIDMYTRCGNLDDARIVFDRLLKRDTVSWNTMMAGYVQHLCNQEAALLFQQMQLEGGEPDRATFLSVLKACTCMSALDQGNMLYDLVVKSGFESDEIVQSTVIHMYIRCGSLKDVTCISYHLSKRDLVTWNALIAGYAQRGDSKSVQQLFKSMQSEGVQPDDTTFVSLLSAVSHVGSVEEGRKLFKSMQQDYRIVPTLDHFNCLVDLLGRAGLLDEAESLLQSMPPIPNIVGWTSLLGHCKTYGNVEVGRRCYSNFVTLDREDATGYVLMWDIFTHLWLEEDADRVEELRKLVKALKMPGKACIEVHNEVYDFIVGESAHPQNDAIYGKLRRLNAYMKEKGNMPCVDFVLPTFDNNSNYVGIGSYQ